MIAYILAFTFLQPPSPPPKPETIPSTVIEVQKKYNITPLDVNKKPEGLESWEDIEKQHQEIVQKTKDAIVNKEKAIIGPIKTGNVKMLPPKLEKGVVYDLDITQEKAPQDCDKSIEGYQYLDRKVPGFCRCINGKWCVVDKKQCSGNKSDCK